MKNILKLFAFSLLATVSMAASDVDQESEDQPFRMTLTTAEDGNIECYGDKTTFWIKDAFGDILAQKQSLSHVKYIELSGIGLTGDFPREIGQLPNLKELNVSDNALTGIDFSGFEKGGDYRRVIEVSVFGNPLNRFTGPTDENMIIQFKYSSDAVAIHFDATAFEGGNLSALEGVLRKNIESTITGESARYNIRISFYEDIPIPHILTEKFGIAHDAHEFLRGTSTTVITRQWSDNSCYFNAEHILGDCGMNRALRNPLLNALRDLLNTVYDDGIEIFFLP